MTRLPYLVFAFFMLVLDQISKWFMSEVIVKPAISNGSVTLEPLPFWDWLTNTPPRLSFGQVEALPFLNWVMVWNEGVSFGMFAHGSEISKWLLIILSLAITSFFVTWLIKTQNSLQAWASALVISGAIGNIIDRFRFGAVIDFIDIHINDWHYPAFNVADSCICIGVGLLILQALFFNQEHTRK